MLKLPVSRSGERRDWVTSAVISFLGQFSQQISSLVITLFAATTLQIGDLGRFMLAIVFVEFVVMFIHAGFFTFLINAKEKNEAVASTMFWTILAIGVSGGALLFASAPVLERVFDAVGLANILQLMALFQPLGAIIAWSSASLIRDGQVGRQYKLMGIGNSVSLVMGVGLLVLWPSVYALVAYRFLRVSVNFALFFRASPYSPLGSFDFLIFRKSCRFARDLFGARMADYLSNFGADLVLAYLFSTTESGQYRIASRLVVAASEIVILPLRTYATKSLSSAANRGLSLVQPVDAYLAAGVILVGGISVTLWILGGPFVSLMLGDERGATIWVVQILAIRAFFLWPHMLLEPFMAATDQTTVALRHSTLWACLSICAVIIAAPNGLVALSIMQTLTAVTSSFAALVLIKRYSDTGPISKLGQTRRAVCWLLAFSMVFGLMWFAVKNADLPLTGELAFGLLAAFVLAGFFLVQAQKAQALSLEIFSGR